MGTFKLQAPARLMFSEILNGAVHGRRLLGWNACSPRLAPPVSRTSTDNVIRADRRFEMRARDSQIVSEFKSKIRQTEDLMAKLSFHLRDLFNSQI